MLRDIPEQNGQLMLNPDELDEAAILVVDAIDAVGRDRSLKRFGNIPAGGCG